MKLLIANRGEIALRVIRTATELGIDTVAVYADDDADNPARARGGRGDRAGGHRRRRPTSTTRAILAAAKESGADDIHPGYGFLSENAAFARACAADGVTFVGPDPAVLDLFGDKSSARAAAVAAGVPVLPAHRRDRPPPRRSAAFFGTHPGGS